MLEEKRPGLTVTEAPDRYLRKQLVDYDGTVLLDETILPHEDLIRFTDRSVKPYRKRLKELEAQKTEEENAQIVQMVKAVHLDQAQLAAFLSAYANGDIVLPGQAQGYIPGQEDSEDEE